MHGRSIPVTTIGGYLGAGKTTLVNAVLAGSTGRRIGVLVNDFGAVSIDEKLIVGRDGDIVALANGCACCSVAGDLGEALDRLAAASAPEHILIEASGVARPARIAALARSPGLEPRAPVVLADTTSVVARAGDKFVGALVRGQLAEAGLVVLTKTDLADAQTRTEARRLVARQARHAQIVEGARGEMDFASIFAQGPSAAPGAFECVDGEADATFDTHLWTSDGRIDAQQMRAAFAALPASVVRAKGVFIASDGAVFAIHRTGDQIDLQRLERAATGRAEIMIIARKGAVDRAAMNALLQMCAANGTFS